MLKSKVIVISFPNLIVEKVDKRRGDTTRSRFITKILEKELGLDSSIEPRLQLRGRVERRLSSQSRSQ